MTGSVENKVQLRVHLASSAEKAFEFLSTDSGRKAFWADAAEERNGIIHYRFSNGMEHQGRILEQTPPRRFSVEYFGGSKVTFELEEDPDGGTDVILIETPVPQEWLTVHKSGWVSVLLIFKAAVDFSIDLRNSDPERSWSNGYVDV